MRERSTIVMPESGPDCAIAPILWVAGPSIAQRPQTRNQARLFTTGRRQKSVHRVYHADSGLYLTRYRAYDPRTARWLSRDPIGFRGGANPYAYVEGDPVNYRDPTGLRPSGTGNFLEGFSGSCSRRGQPLVRLGRARSHLP